MNSPDRALVLCVDEKSRIQALDRTQPGLPLTMGRAATMTDDYKRHGTTTLFAALDTKTGLFIGKCQPRHRDKEFVRFLKRIDWVVAKHLDLHLVLDNSGERILAQYRDKTHTARDFYQRGRIGAGGPRPSRQTQCRTQTLRMDKVRRGHSRKRSPRPC